MLIRGRLIPDRSGAFAVEVPALCMHTQGRNRAVALRMAIAWVRDMLDKPKLEVTATADAHGNGFALRCANPAIIGLMLRQRRAAAGLSVRDMAARMGSASPAAWHRYETGERIPGVDQLDRLLTATGSDLVLA